MTLSSTGIHRKGDSQNQELQLFLESRVVDGERRKRSFGEWEKWPVWLEDPSAAVVSALKC